MHLRRRNTFLLVYVSATELKVPIAIPLPIVVVEELLQAVLIITWLCTPLIRSGQMMGNLQHKVERLPVALPTSWAVSPWRVVAAIRGFVTELRYAGAITFVEVEASDARVLIKLV